MTALRNYYFRSEVGIFSIRPQDGVAARFLLSIGDEPLGSYRSPQAAADDVYGGVTGHYAWDVRNDPHAPTDLSEWNIGSS